MNGIAFLPDEKVILSYGIHWKRYVVPFFGIGASTFILTVRLWLFGTPLIPALERYIQNVNYDIISLGEIVVCAIFFLWSIGETIRCATTAYCITDRRIIAKKGWLNIKVSEMVIERCETIMISHPIMGRILNYGDILAVSAGASIFLDDVPNPYGFKAVILEHVKRQSL